MEIDGSPALSALRSETRALAAALGQLGDIDLPRLTQCEPWTAHTLAAHVIRGLRRTTGMVAAPSGTLADENPLIYYQSPLRSDPQRDTVRTNGAVTTAAQFSSAAELATALEDTIASIVNAIAVSGNDIAVETHWGPVMHLESYLVTRVVEMAVHGIDLADCLEAPPWLTQDAAAVVVGLIHQLLGEDLPSLGWSQETLIRTATGRRDLTNDEGLALGALAERFPLLT